MKKLKHVLLCSVFAIFMGISLMSTNIHAGTGEENGGTPPPTEEKEKKAEFKNLQVIARNNFQRVEFSDFKMEQYYQIAVEDLIEHGVVEGNYKIRYENKSNSVFRFQPQSQDVSDDKFTDVVEGTGIGMKDANCISLQPLKKGTGTLEVTITDLENSTNTITKSVSITIGDKKEEIVEDESVVASSVSNIFENEDVVNRIYKMIENDKVSSPTITFDVKGEQNNIKMPKEILQAVKDNNKPLTVNLTRGIANDNITWHFPSADKIIDMDLNIHIRTSKELGINDVSENNMVLDFEHHGALPTGTTVRIHVGEKFNVGDKITLAYYNEATKKLEEAKEYVVESDYYVTFAIPHCSSYVVQTTTDYNQSIKPTVPEVNPTPEAKPSIPEIKPTPEVKSKTDTIIKNTASPQTGDNTNIIGITSIALLSAIVLVSTFRKLAKTK